ncbi:hypothetical protein [Rubrolithibacter danxiaensis]|uniref:hypothetical protein n=1 Tax=Rubrolithibacter danxiaensis TaxID=3390805 RepID=UPI003BF7BE16
MFTNITWTNYIVVIILLLVIYYLFVGIRFYYQDLKNIIDKRTPQVDPEVDHRSFAYPNTVNAQPRVLPLDSAAPNSEDDPFQEVEHLVCRLKDAAKEASDKKALKEEFAQYLRLILKEYPELKTSPFQSAIIELITSECAKYGSITLSEDEVVMLWSDL